MLTALLAFAAFFVAEMVGNVLTSPFHAIDKRVQWGGRAVSMHRVNGSRV